jgi:uncharacterized membrane protein YphA (DoxX/SURF4 family)
MDKMDKNFSKYAFPMLRYGMALVYFYFAISQLMNPKLWIGYLPGFLATTSNPVIFIYMNVIFEIIFGILLSLGIFTRAVAFLLGLHLVAIAITIGFEPTGVRDIGLAIATLSIALNGTDWLCIENKWKKK